MQSLTRKLFRVTSILNTRNTYGFSRVGNRDVVGHGTNGMYNYKDDAHFPFPAVRFMENTPEICVLRNREMCDWNCLTCDEKKALYRASFCQTFAEFQHNSGHAKFVIGGAFFIVGCGVWLYTFTHFYVNEPLPEHLSEENQKLQLRRMLEIRTNPIDGISSRWDYVNDDWK